MMQKHSLTIAGHRTSVSLEPEFWAAFLAAAQAEGLSANQLASRIDRSRHSNLSSAIRVWLYLRCQNLAALPHGDAGVDTIQ